MTSRMLLRAVVAGTLLGLAAFAADAGRVQRDGGAAAADASRATAAFAAPAPDSRTPTDGPSFMAVDRQGTTWAVWTYRRGLELDIAVSREIGDTWSTPELVGAANVDDLDPRIAFLPDNTPVLVWWQRGQTPADNRVVWSWLSPDAGWSAPRAVDRIPGSQPNVFTGQDQVTVAWLADDGELHTVVIRWRIPATAGGTGNNGPDPVPTGKR